VSVQPAFKHRALMLDPGRVMEKKSYYFFLLPWLKEWGYNALHLHLTDDEGCALVFPSHPEFASIGAFTAEEMRDLIKAGEKHGMEIIPEIESLGHTKFITRDRKYRHLGAGNGKIDSLNAIDPAHPDTRHVLADLFKDAADIFTSPIIHAGLDEVDFSVLPAYRSVPKEEHWKIFARHAGWVHELIRKHDKRPAMWGDHILSAKRMADKFKRDVLIFDWHYDPEFSPESLDFFCKHGFEVWGCPSSICYRSRVVTNATNLANLREFTAHALMRRRRGVTGMVNTVWAPWRYLSGAIDWPIAFAGHLFHSEEENNGYCKEFCGSFYGLKNDDAERATDAFTTLYNIAPWSRWYEVMLGVQSRKDAFTREHRRRCATLIVEARLVTDELKRLLSKAKKNAERLEDVYLSAEFLYRLGCFGAANQDKSRLPDGATLYKKCETSWNRSRYEPWQNIFQRYERLPDHVLASAKYFV